MPVVSTENVSVFIPLILRGKVSGSGAQIMLGMGLYNNPHPTGYDVMLIAYIGSLFSV